MQGPRSARRRRSLMGIGQIAPTGTLRCPHQWLRNSRIDERAAGAHGQPRERLGTSVSDSGDVGARRRAGRASADTTLTAEDEELRAWLVHAGEAARQFLEVRAGETLTDPIDLEIRGHCEAVVAFDDGLRPEMTIAELADHFDEIQRLAEARADATLKGIRERADEAGGTQN